MNSINQSSHISDENIIKDHSHSYLEITPNKQQSNHQKSQQINFKNLTFKKMCSSSQKNTHANKISVMSIPDILKDPSSLSLTTRSHIRNKVGFIGLQRKCFESNKENILKVNRNIC